MRRLLQDLFALIYQDASTCREYHATENGDPHADVGPWVDGTRVVLHNHILHTQSYIEV